jgi:hypothetical protein
LKKLIVDFLQEILRKRTAKIERKHLEDRLVTKVIISVVLNGLATV